MTIALLLLWASGFAGGVATVLLWRGRSRAAAPLPPIPMDDDGLVRVVPLTHCQACLEEGRRCAYCTADDMNREHRRASQTISEHQKH